MTGSIRLAKLKAFLSIPFDSHLLVIGLWWQPVSSNIFICSTQSPLPLDEMLTLNMCALHELQVPRVSFLPSASTWIETVLLLICAMHNWIKSSSFTSYCTCLTVLLARTEELIFWMPSCFPFKIHGLSFWGNDFLHQSPSQGPGISRVQARRQDRMLCSCSSWFMTTVPYPEQVIPLSCSIPPNHAISVLKSRLLPWQSGALNAGRRWNSLPDGDPLKSYQRWLKPFSPFPPPDLILYHFFWTSPAFCSMLLI